MLFDIVDRKKDYLIGALLGAMAGAFVSLAEPVRWEARAVIKVGYIMAPQVSGVAFIPIEPPQVVVERLKARSFLAAAAKRAKDEQIAAFLDPDEGAALKVRVIRNTDLLSLSVAGGPSELVRISMEGLVDELIYKHNLSINSYLEDILREIESIDSEIKSDLKRAAETSVSRERPLRQASAEFDQMAAVKYVQLTKLRERVAASNFRSTALIEPISFFGRRKFEPLWRASVFGAISGISLAVIWVLWLGRLKNKR